MKNAAVRHDWSFSQVKSIYDRPLLELIYDAATVHRQYFNPSEVQVNKLISIKTGGCSEDCHYCPQSARYNTGLKRKKLMDKEEVMGIAQKAMKSGSSRVCLGAAWREVKDGKDFDQVLDIVKNVSQMGLEVCCTLGMLKPEHAQKLKEAGLYAYNHNIDTSGSHYKKIISTRDYSDRLNTLDNVRKAELSVCCGGIIGLGEKEEDRIQMLVNLASMDPHPDSVPINTLVPVKGTPLGDSKTVSAWDWARMVATTRIVLPKSFVRLSAGRLGRSIEAQALCFMAGANSIFTGDKLLTTPNPGVDKDQELFDLLGLKPLKPFAKEMNECSNQRYAGASLS